MQSADLSSLLPLAVDTDQTADSSGQTDEAVIQVSKSKSSKGDSDIAEIREELEVKCRTLPNFSNVSHVILLKIDQVGKHEEQRISSCQDNVLLDSLACHNTLAILLIDLGLLLSQVIEGVGSGYGAEQQSRQPESVGLLLQSLGRLALPDSGGIQDSQAVQRQVSGIA